jgi:DNA-binding transcriptional ArsR family regulator
LTPAVFVDKYILTYVYVLIGGFMAQVKTEYLDVDTNLIARIKESMVSENMLKAMSENFKALSDPNRIRILIALENGELCVCDLAALIELPQPSVSHHLKALRQLGIVKFRKSGKMTLYSLADNRVSGLLAVARDFSRK